MSDPVSIGNVLGELVAKGLSGSDDGDPRPPYSAGSAATEAGAEAVLRQSDCAAAVVTGEGAASGARRAERSESRLVAGAGEDQGTPPLTNRGCFTPEGGVVFHLDYLKLTVFDMLSMIQTLIESALFERAGLPFTEWVDKGAVARWEHIYEGPGPIYILVPKGLSAAYKMVEMRGQGCAAFGAEAIQGFLALLSAQGIRYHAVRVDLAFDHVGFTPAEVDAAIRRGDINSRCLGPADRSWVDSETGQTVYLGRRDQIKQRRLRVYNKNGFTRCEAELRGDWAKAAVQQFAKAPVGEWPRIALGHLRGMVDFVDSSANERPERCPLLPWWAELVEKVERIRNLPEEDRPQKTTEEMRHAMAKVEMRVMRIARSLWPIMQAFGPDYLLDRITHYGERNLRDEDRQFAEELKRYRCCGLAGLPGELSEDDDVPI